ncbi:MAG: lysophospholipid acyltransferase family protein [Alphaproteobacteria bacterium]
MTVLRSVLFNLVFFAWSGAMALVLWPALLLPPQHLPWIGRLWARGCLALLSRTVRLSHEVRGRAHLPEGPVIVASKHQSAWDTIVFFLLFANPAYVLKAELLLIPIIGWYLRRVGMIAIDRDGGARALKGMLAAAKRAIGEGRPIVIFPEGTRTAPGATRPYHPGTAALYAHLGLPVVPVALNSGLYWGRRRFIKRPGRIVVEFLPAIAPGMERRAFGAELERRIEEAVARLVAEGRSQSS